MTLPLIFQRVVLLVVVVVLWGCAGGTTQFAQSERVRADGQAIGAGLLVVFETGHLRKAFREAAHQSNDADLLVSGVLSSFKSELTKDGIVVVAEAFESASNPTALASAIARNRGASHILVLRSGSFETSQLTRYGVAQGPATWNGNVTWALSLYDTALMGKGSDSLVWKGATAKVQVGQAWCKQDSYKECSTRIVKAVSQQLRAERLLITK